MAKYLLKVSYTLEGIKGLRSEGGAARKAAAEAAAKSAGGSIESFYFAFGEKDVYSVCEFPDNTAAAAFALAVTSGGGATGETIVLISPEEMDEAARREVGYRPPGA
jgi:uncharacterized protein with GYD domain